MKIGQIAPDFTLPDQDRVRFNLGQHLGKGPIVIFFYPKDDSPVCTAEACAFRDRFQIFQTMGAQVIGISSDPEESHQSFASKHKLPFTLLSDEKGEVPENGISWMTLSKPELFDHLGIGQGPFEFGLEVISQFLEPIGMQVLRNRA